MNRVRRHILIGAANKYNLTYTDNNAIFYKRRTANGAITESKPLKFKVDEIRGKSIVWNQLLKNGDFSNSEGWVLRYGAIITNNRLQFTGPSFYDYFAGQTINIPRGRKVLLSVKYAMVGQESIWFEIKNDVVGSVAYLDAASTGSLSNFNTLSVILDTSGDRDVDLFAIMGKELETELSVIVDRVSIIDLTLMFGAGNEPATVADFEKMFPLDYYDYNEGEVIPFAGQNLVTVGFNQWNEEWELGIYNTTTGNKSANTERMRCKNRIPIISDRDYFFRTPPGIIAWVICFDANGNVISGDSWTGGIQRAINARSMSSSIFHTPSNGAYLVFYTTIAYGKTYNHDICINLSDPDKNGTYEPYEKHTLPLDPANWRDKQGNLVFPYGGMHGVGTAYDYAKVDADGYIRKAVRCFGQVDLGSLDWNLSTRNVFYATIDDILGLKSKGICGGYPVINTYLPPDSPFIQEDKVVLISSYGGPWKGRFGVKDSSYTDVATFKAAIQGVPLIYELAEPIEIELAAPIYVKGHAHSYGTEEIAPENTQIPYTTPVHMSIEYYSKK